MRAGDWYFALSSMLRSIQQQDDGKDRTQHHLQLGQENHSNHLFRKLDDAFGNDSSRKTAGGEHACRLYCGIRQRGGHRGPDGGCRQRDGEGRRRQRDPARGQAFRQGTPRCRQPVGQGGRRQVELPGNFAPRAAFEITKDKGQAQPVGQRGQLRIKDRLEVVPHLTGQNLGVRRGDHLLLLRPATDQVGPRLARRSMSDAIEPITDLFARANHGGTSREHQEYCLKGVLRKVPVADHAPADAEYHRPMPPHQRRERRLIAHPDEFAKQLPIGQRAAVAGHGDPAKVGKQPRIDT